MRPTSPAIWDALVAAASANRRQPNTFVWHTLCVAGTVDSNSLPPSPSNPPTVSFTGGIRCGTFGMGASAPFGHLEFDGDDLRLWGAGMDVKVHRTDVLGIRLSTGILATHVRVVYPDESLSEVYFAALGRRAVRAALRERGWPVIETGRSH